MSALRPLIESSASERGREMLRAARADGPRVGAAGRALAALGVAGTTATAAGAAVASAGGQTGAGLSAAATASLPMIAAKWLVVGALSGVALASGTALVFSQHERTAAPNRRVVEAPAGTSTAPMEQTLKQPASAPIEAAPEPVASKAPRPVPSAAGSSSATAATAPVAGAAPSQGAFASPEQSQLLRDIALLDAARRALKTGDTARALALIARYDSERQTHILDREAQLLRIDVLVARGSRQQARALAQKYLAAFPNDAHAERLRALVSKGE